MTSRVEWDEAKAASNLRKHGISFLEAAYVFDDPNLLSENDRVVDGEERWRSLGMVRGCLLLLVAHTWTEESEEGELVEVFRIISARPAERKEWLLYGQNR